MLALFKTNQLFTSILLLPYLVLLRFSGFLTPPATLLQDAGVASDYVFQWVEAGSLIGQAVAVILLLVQAFIVNYIVAQHRLMNITNLLPGLFYVLIASTIPNFLYLSPILLANTFLLFSVAAALNCYKNNFAATSIFNMGLWIGIASLFYGSVILFVLWSIFALSTLRSFQFKEVSMVLLGDFIPYLFLGTTWFWNDQFAQKWQIQISGQLGFLNFQGILDTPLMIKLVIFGLFILLAVLSYGAVMNKKNMPAQKKITVLYQFLLVSVFTILIQYGVTADHFLLTAIPLGFIFGLRFSDLNSRASETLHFLMVVLILFYQLSPQILG